MEAYAPLARKNTLLFDNKEIKEIGEKYGRTIAQIVLRWGIQNGFVVIPKSKNETHIKENLEIFDFELSKEEMNYISGLKKGIHTCWNPDTIKF